MERDARDNRPKLPPVEKIQLSEKHQKLRWAAVAIFLVIGVAFLGYAFNLLITQDAGWAEIKASTTDAASTCAGDFTLMYDLGAGEKSATQERRELAALYTQAAADAQAVFSGISAINQNPNRAVTLDPALYAALEQAAESRELYLAPIREWYYGVFLCAEDYQTEDYDPAVNGAMAEFMEKVAGFVAGGHIRLELLDDGQARLTVSREYLEFLEAEGAETLVDFGWMKNAFIADYLAQRLSQAGYTRGALSSYDGFVRNLDGESGADYALNLLARNGGQIQVAGILHYQGPMALACLRSFPVSELDGFRFYSFQDGRVLGPYLDQESGRPVDGPETLVGMSRDMGCGKLALRLSAAYAGITPASAGALGTTGMDCVLVQDGRVYYTQETCPVTNLLNVTAEKIE